MSIENIKLIWNDITIDITYDNDWSKPHREIMGFSIARLEIKSKNQERLPITGRGYRSEFIATTLIKEKGGGKKFLIDWLDENAKSTDWQRYWRSSKQLSLFYHGTKFAVEGIS